MGTGEACEDDYNLKLDDLVTEFQDADFRDPVTLARWEQESKLLYDEVRDVLVAAGFNVRVAEATSLRWNIIIEKITDSGQKMTAWLEHDGKRSVRAGDQYEPLDESVIAGDIWKAMQHLSDLQNRTAKIEISYDIACHPESY